MTDTAGMGEPTRCPQCDRRLMPDEVCPICPDDDAEPEMSREQAYQAFRDIQDKYEGDSDVYDPLQQVYADACRAGELAKALLLLQRRHPGVEPGCWCDGNEAVTAHHPRCLQAAAALAAWQGAQ